MVTHGPRVMLVTCAGTRELFDVPAQSSTRPDWQSGNPESGKVWPKSVTAGQSLAISAPREGWPSSVARGAGRSGLAGSASTPSRSRSVARDCGRPAPTGEEVPASWGVLGHVAGSSRPYLGASE